MLVLFCVALLFILRALHVLKSSRALFFSCFFIRLSIVITSLGEEGTGLCASRAFVCLFVLYVLVFVIFLFLLVLGVGCGL